MKNTKDYLNTHAYESPSDPMIAACLFDGLNPDETIYFDYTDQQYRPYHNNTAIYNSARALNDTASKAFQRISNIFHFIDNGLKKGLSPCEQLMVKVKEIFDNYIQQDKESFLEQYPYIVRDLKLETTQQDKPQDTPIVTVKERNAQWNNLWKQIQALPKKPGQKIGLKLAAKMIENYLSKDNLHHYLINKKNKKNEQVCVDTIEKTIRDYYESDYDKTITPLKYKEFEELT